jgi:hypothetical protein
LTDRSAITIHDDEKPRSDRGFFHAPTFRMTAGGADSGTIAAITAYE